MKGSEGNLLRNELLEDQGHSSAREVNSTYGPDMLEPFLEKNSLEFLVCPSSEPQFCFDSPYDRSAWWNYQAYVGRKLFKLSVTPSPSMKDPKAVFMDISKRKGRICYGFNVGL